MLDAKAKGSQGEREMCKWLKWHLGIDCQRNVDQVRTTGEVNADIVLDTAAFEVKRCQTLNLSKWWQQITKAVHGTNKEPIVAYRQNHKKWHFLISAQHLGLNEGFIQLTEDVFLNWCLNGQKSFTGGIEQIKRECN